MDPSKIIEQIVKNEDIYDANAPAFVTEIKKKNKFINMIIFF